MSLKLSAMSESEKDEAIVVYASLLLHDAGLEITGDKISEVIKESGNEVEAYWPALFAGLLANSDLKELILSSAKPGSGGSGGGSGGAAAAGAGGAKGAEEEKKEEKKEEEAAEVVEGAGGLFGDEDKGGY